MWDELREEIVRMFEAKSIEMGLQAELELSIIEDAPIDGEFVYGEAFPEESMVWLEVVGPDASGKKILQTICHELVHIQYPEWNHDSVDFERLTKRYSHSLGCILSLNPS